MNLILISIPNDIYNSMDACTTAKSMWERVERLMRGTVQNQVDRETHFNNEFDQFVAESGEALVSVYNCFAQLMNDLERNHIKFLPVTINTKFLNCLQPEWFKYVTQVCLAKRLTEDSYDDLFDYLQQFEKLLNASREKNEKGHYARNFPKPRVRDSKYFMEQMLTDEQNDFLFVDASRMEEIEELSANICFMARIQPANIDSEAGSSYNSAFLNEVQTPSTSYVNLLLDKDDQEQHYLTQPNIINNTIGDDQIDTNIIFDAQNDDVNSGSVKEDNIVQPSYELEQLAMNAFREVEKQQKLAKNIQQQNIVLTNQLESYKEKVQVFEITNKNNTNYFNEYIEADRKAKHFEQESQS
ncbi:hypothetical protein Tco_0209628 [Tanacetum coccineum]